MKAQMALDALSANQQTQVCGPQNANLKRIHNDTGARISVANNHLLISGGSRQVSQAQEQLAHLIKQATTKQSNRRRDSDHRTGAGRSQKIEAMTNNQKRFLEAAETCHLLFGLGPAGSGKTLLSVSLALQALEDNRVSKVVFVRPAREAGEALGFLPGTIDEKVGPYQRAVMDALDRLMGQREAQRSIESGRIQIEAVGYMRGRSLDNTCLVVDEAQNTTIAQLKMLITRIGYDSMAIVTGDPSQCDLNAGEISGLAHATRILKSIPQIAVIEFDNEDIVRHPIIGKILQAYDEDSKRNTR